MKKWTIFIILTIFAGNELLFCQPLSWKKPIHAGYKCYSIATDTNNSVYSLCDSYDQYLEYFDTIPVPRNIIDSHNLFVARTDSNNLLQYLTLLETSWSTSSQLLKISPDQNCIVAGKVWDRLSCHYFDMNFVPHEKPPFFILQLGKTGYLDWVNLIYNDNIYAYLKDMTFDSQKNLYLVGNTSSSVTFGNFDLEGAWRFSKELQFPGSGTTSFIAKYSPDGKFESATILPIVNDFGEDDLILKSIIVDNSGNIYVTGWFEGRIDYEGTVIQSEDLEILILKFDPEMHLVWTKHFSPGSHYGMLQQGNSLAFDTKKENFYITGNFVGTLDFGNGPVKSEDENIFLAKYSLDGNLKWIKKSGCWSGVASYTEEGQKVIVDKDDFVFLSGFFSGTLHIGDTTLNVYIDPIVANDYFDVFIAKYHANGDFSWAAHAGGEYTDYLGSIARDHAKHLYLGGYGSSRSTFGDYELVPPTEGSWGSGFLGCFNDRPESNKFEPSFGIQHFSPDESNISVFPNPFRDQLNIEFKDPVQSEISIHLVNSSGKCIFSETRSDLNETRKLSIDLPGLNPGLYLLTLTFDRKFYVYKLQNSL